MRGIFIALVWVWVILAAQSVGAQTSLSQANGALCAMSTGYDASATAIVVATGCGTRYPSVPFYAVWWNNTDYPGGFTGAGVRDPNFEVVLVTNVATDTLTVTRAQQGTSASTKNTGGKTYFLNAAPTAQTYTDLSTALGASMVTLGTNSVLANERVLTGTSNQIAVTDNGAGSTVVLSTPQSIATTSSPTWAGETLVGADGGNTLLTWTNHQNSLTPNTTINNFLARKSSGTAATPLRTQAADVLLRVSAGGYEAVDDVTSASQVSAHRASIDFLSGTGDWTTSDNGAYVRVRTTASGGVTTNAKAFLSEQGLELSTGNTAPTSRGTTNPTNAINLFDGTAPAGTLTNGVSLYSASGQLRAMDSAGVSQRLTYPLTKSITIESPTSSEDLSLFFADDAITIVKMVAVLVGSSTPSVTWTIRHGTDRSAAGAEVVTSGTTTTSTTTGSVVTSFNDATVIADSFVWVETTAQSGTVGQINITIYYTID